MSKIIDAAHIIGFTLVEALKNEFRQQGHNATNKLINSVRYDVVSGDAGIEDKISYLDYGQYVDTGRRAGAKGVPIDVLERWIKLLNIPLKNNQTVRQLAFIFQRAIKEQGSPTRGSFKYTNNGRRKDFSLQVISEKYEFITNTVQNASFSFLETEVIGILSKL